MVRTAMRNAARAAAALLALAAPAAGQLVLDADGNQVEDGTNANKKPFKLALVTPAVQESLEDLERQFARGAWEKAFDGLAKLRGQKASGFAAGPDGLCQPIELRVQRMLANLSAAGRDAFKLFHDPEAKRRLAEAVGKEERAKLEEIVQWYAPCTAADEAAYRLGDLLYEEGRHADAAALWQGILDNRPDSAVPQPKLLLKLGLAYARGGRKAEVHRLAARLKERYPDARATLGGAELDPAARLAELGAALAPPAVVSDAGEQASRIDRDLSLPPEGTAPAWRHAYLRPKAQAQVGNRVVEVPGALAAAPAAALANGKLMLNFSTLVVALDVGTGKVAWRTGAPHESLAANPQQRQVFWRRFNDGSGGAPMPAFALARNGRLHYSKAAGDPNQGTSTTEVKVLDVATGKPVEDQTLAAGFAPASLPIFAPDGTYYIGTRSGRGSELHAVRVAPGGGAAAWSTPLGQYNFDANGYYYNVTMPNPRCLLAGDRLYVDTHWGTALELDARTGRLRWAVHYDADPIPNPNYYNQYAAATPPCGPLAFADGMVYTKGMMSQRLVALRSDPPGVAWQRPVPKPTLLVNARPGRLTLGGEELLSFDTQRREAVWAAKLPAGAERQAPLETPNQLAYCTARGIFVFDQRTGDTLGMFRGADADSSGGQLFVAGDLLIAVTDVAATAYRMPKPTP